MLQYLLVGLGGAVGAILRFGLYKLFEVHALYWVTLLINIAGSFIIGFFIAGTGAENMQAMQTRWLIAIGFCGGFTTFSSFSADNVNLLAQGKFGLAALYSFLSVLCCVAACFAGYKISSSFS